MPVPPSNQDIPRAEGSAPLNTPAGSPAPTDTHIPKNSLGPTSVGEPEANRFRAQGDGPVRQRLHSNPRRSTRASPNSVAPTPNAETSAPSHETAALGPAGEAAQPPSTAESHPAADNDGTTTRTPSTDVNPAITKADVEKIREQIARQKNSNPISLAGLSDSTKDELMTQLGHKDMTNEGTRQADKQAEDMAEEGDVWYGI